ncbi:hypothetical protein G6F64_013363 [Rhizopus arrhizus]|uniref:Uncharacterized protein n=1 Tax=Rhizopus oryzae TaxID=64495 RepID=A0A9P6WW25_RHIOR|nr:hypothetical protein G6F64_013363 [Rhizopus arrhizus]
MALIIEQLGIAPAAAGKQRQQQRQQGQGSRSPPAPRLAGHDLRTAVAQQPPAETGPVLVLCAGFQAGAAGQAIGLRPLADVQLHRAGADTRGAVGAVPQAVCAEGWHRSCQQRMRRAEHIVLRGGRVEQATAATEHAAQAGWARSARLAAARVIQDTRCMRIGQQWLQACERAQRTADRLAQETGIAPGGSGVEQYPERFPATPGGVLPVHSDSRPHASCVAGRASAGGSARDTVWPIQSKAPLHSVWGQAWPHQMRPAR